MFFGGGLLLLMLLGHVANHITNQSESDALRLKLPGSLLDLPRNDQAMPAALDKAEAMISELDPDQSAAGFYGTRLGGVLVVGARDSDPLDDPSELVADALAGAASVNNLALEASEDIDPGPRGGAARCIAVTSSDGGRAFACAFADEHGILMISDSITETMQDAASRAGTVRNHVVVDRDTPAAVATTPAPAPTATISLPRTLAGATLDRHELVKERSEFVSSTRRYLDRADLGLYVGPRNAFIVETGAGDVTPRQLLLRLNEAALRADIGKSLSAATPLSPGSLGGAGYGWSYAGEGGVKRYVVLLLDDAAYVQVYDYRSRSLADAAALARQVRAQVEHRIPS